MIRENVSGYIRYWIGVCHAVFVPTYFLFFSEGGVLCWSIYMYTLAHLKIKPFYHGSRKWTAGSNRRRRRRGLSGQRRQSTAERRRIADGRRRGAGRGAQRRRFRHGVTHLDRDTGQIALTQNENAEKRFLRHFAYGHHLPFLGREKWNVVKFHIMIRTH